MWFKKKKAYSVFFFPETTEKVSKHWQKTLMLYVTGGINTPLLQSLVSVQWAWFTNREERQRGRLISESYRQDRSGSLQENKSGRGWNGGKEVTSEIGSSALRKDNCQQEKFLLRDPGSPPDIQSPRGSVGESQTGLTGSSRLQAPSHRVPVGHVRLFNSGIWMWVTWGQGTFAAALLSAHIGSDVAGWQLLLIPAGSSSLAQSPPTYGAICGLGWAGPWVN